MEEQLLERLATLIVELRAAKPADRSELARRYAVVITDLEKVLAYFGSFIAFPVLWPGQAAPRPEESEHGR